MTPDSQVHGLFKRPTSKGDKWVVSARVKGGNPTKVTIGYCSNLPIKEARSIAKKHLADMAQGINPNTTRKLQQAKGLTLKQAIEQYIDEKSDSIKPSTIRSYNSTLKNNLTSWMNLPISSITPQDCVKRYKAIQQEVAARSKQKTKVNTPGEAEAQKAMRTLHTVLQYFANDMLPDNSGRLLPYGNPVDGLTDKGIKKQLKPRTRSLSFRERTQLLEFLTHPSHTHDEAMKPKHETPKTPVKIEHTDWLLLLLCTGLRRDEPLKMTWADVDFVTATFTVTDTKNGSPLTLPMTERVKRIFERRAKQLESISSYVFPQSTNPAKPATMNRVPERISKLSGIDFTAHDLRRTAATALNELGYSVEDIGRILNHSRKSVTDQYIQTSIEHLRDALQELENILFNDDGTQEIEATPEPDWN